MLRQIATACDLQIAPGAELQPACDDLEHAFTTYVAFARTIKGMATPAEIRDWAEAIIRWTEEGTQLFGGNSACMLPQADEDSSAFWNAVSSLSEVWPNEKTDRATGARFVAANAPTKYSDARDFVRRLLPTLRVAHMLAARIKDRAKTVAKPRVSFQQIALYDDLRPIFERLHLSTKGLPAQFVVATRLAKPQDNTHRQHVPDGPAIKWCKELFRSAEKMMGRDEAREFIAELAATADRTDAIAGQIRAARARFNGNS